MPVIKDEYKKRLIKFLKTYKLKSNNFEIILQAFMHRSFAFEKDKKKKNNERLEFLGDAVIELIISDYLYKDRPDIEEGQLTKLRSALVNANRLSKASKELKLDDFLLLGRGSEGSGDRKRKSVLSDMYEAFVGAIYLTCKYKNVRAFVLKTLNPDNIELSDPKSELQEYCQKKYKMIPQYNIVDTYGPAHKKNFVVEVVIKDKKFGPAKGLTKKEAEQQSAKIALDFFRNNQ